MSVTKLPTAMTPEWREAERWLREHFAELGLDEEAAAFMVRRYMEFGEKVNHSFSVKSPPFCGGYVDAVAQEYQVALEKMQIEVLNLFAEMWALGAR